jgi:hypothetical protein
MDERLAGLPPRHLKSLLASVGGVLTGRAPGPGESAAENGGMSQQMASRLAPLFGHSEPSR